MCSDAPALTSNNGISLTDVNQITIKIGDWCVETELDQQTQQLLRVYLFSDTIGSITQRASLLYFIHLSNK